MSFSEQCEAVDNKEEKLITARASGTKTYSQPKLTVEQSDQRKELSAQQNELSCFARTDAVSPLHSHYNARNGTIFAQEIQLVC